MDVTIRWIYMHIYHAGVQRKWLWSHDHRKDHIKVVIPFLFVLD